MNEEEYQKMYDFEKFYWWHVGRQKIIKTFLSLLKLSKDSKILDIGCGTGGNMEILSSFGKVIGLDRSIKAKDFCEKQGFGNVMLGDIDNIPTMFGQNSFDLVTAFDVLEHLDGDEKTMKDVLSILKKGGHFLITVPAYQFLWSEHDEALQHKRRYDYKQLKSKLTDAGFEIIKGGYVITFIAPVIIAFRGVKNIFKNKKEVSKTDYIILPGFANKMLIWSLELEAFLSKYCDLPFGISAICIAKKP